MKKIIITMLALCLVLAIAMPVCAAELDTTKAPATTDLGVVTVAAITALVYIIGLGVRATPMDNKWIPVICGVSGIVLGIIALYIGVPDYPATDPITAAAVGGASGLAATGINQIAKQLTQ